MPQNFFGFFRLFQVEMMFANDALGIARLQRRFSNLVTNIEMNMCSMMSCERPNF